MKNIIISPYSVKLPGNKRNPKNYPYWEELLKELTKMDYYIIQTGVGEEAMISGVNEFLKDLKLKDLEELIKKCYTWISVDSFFQHFATYFQKRGFVIFGKSNPNIFGHRENINIYKDEKYFRKNQFNSWIEEEYLEECFPEPQIILKKIKEFNETNNGY